MTTAARRVVTFRPSALFKAYVNGGSIPGQDLLSRCRDRLVLRYDGRLCTGLHLGIHRR